MEYTWSGDMVRPRRRRLEMAATAAVDETATAAASLRVSDPKVDATPVVKGRKADVLPSVKSTKDVTETEKTDKESTVPAAENASEHPADAATLKPAAKPATPRPIVRDSLGADEQQPPRPHRAKDGRPTSETEGATVDAAKPESSSAASPSNNSSAKGKGSSASDTDGSE